MNQAQRNNGYAYRVRCACALLAVLVLCAGMSCCNMPSQGKICAHEPLDIINAIHLTIKTGDTIYIQPMLLTETDYRSLLKSSKQPHPSLPAKDDVVAYKLIEYEKALVEGRKYGEFSNSRIVSVELGKLLSKTVIWSMSEINPTEFIQGITFKITDGKKVVNVEVGDLVRVENYWKLDGWIVMSEVH
jgi:hypothetical protein